jgi:hypothetical protein
MRSPDVSAEELGGPAGAPVGVLSIRDRDDRGVIRVWGWGEWSPDYVDRHFAELTCRLEQARAEGQPVRLLVNLQKAASQSPETLARIRAGAERAHHADDRIAMVVESDTIKAQTNRLSQRVRLDHFISETAAVLWLTPDPMWQRTIDSRAPAIA